MMEEKDWKMLLHTLYRGNCILFLGPEMAQDQSVSWTQILARQLVNEMKRQSRPGILLANDLAHVARKYSDYNSPVDLQIAATHFYEDRQNLTSKPYLNLAALPFNLVVNTTPDACFAEALRRHNKSFQIDGYHHNGPRPGLAPTGTAENPLIYYLYGYIEEPESLVISENDLLDFLVSVISKDPPLPTNISSEFKDESKCFLFLGFSFNNWYLRILFHVLQGQHPRNRSFALEATDPKQDLAHQGAILFFKDTYKIYHYCLDLEAFTEELKDRYIAKYGTNDAVVRTPEAAASAEAPTAFLCHASENAAYAAELSEKLKAAGIEPWLDKDALKTGDDWNRRIEKTIAEVDYVLILQSKAMQHKDIAYVNKEINLALQRKLEFRPGIRFIMPLVIEEGGELDDFEDLSKLQTLNMALDQEQGLVQLVNAIERDFERRKRK